MEVPAGVPLLLSEDARVGILGETLREVQLQQFKLEVTQAMNGHESADTVPGDHVSYAQRYAALHHAQLQITQRWPELIARLAPAS